MSIAEVARYVARWKDEPPIAVVLRAALGVKPQETATDMQLSAKTDLTQAEYDEMVAAMRGNAEMYGRRRN